MRKAKLTFIVIIIIAALGAAGALAYTQLRSDETGDAGKTAPTVSVSAAAKINSFEECAAQGYPVMESYPPRCIADGREFVQKVDGGGAITVPPAPAYEVLSAEVRLRTPHSNDIVTNPLTVEGDAAGWYFEGEFPVRLLDGNGVQLTWSSARAQGDWMTTASVPFRATLTFTPPATATGTLVLEKSDPRGEGAATTLQIPVRFNP